MPTDSRVDEYIADAPEFAKPILRDLSELVHEVCPNVTEDIKWSRPNFLHGGKILCGMVALKAHCSFYVFGAEIGEQFGEEDRYKGLADGLARITQRADLPPRKNLSRYIRDAVRLLDESLANPSRRKRAAQPKPQAGRRPGGRTEKEQNSRPTLPKLEHESPARIH
jgi:uncharacterized protein YdhG (YjbR/CyaY superfamily)